MSETIKSNIDSFYSYLFGVIKLHRELIPKLKDELMLIESGSVEALNENISKQQSFVFKTRGFDREIDRYTKALNLKGNNLTEVIAQLPAADHLRFYGLIAEFDEAVKEVNFYKQKCRDLLETKLHMIDRKMNALKDNQSDKDTYSNEGKKQSSIGLPKTFEKKI